MDIRPENVRIKLMERKEIVDTARVFLWILMLQKGGRGNSDGFSGLRNARHVEELEKQIGSRYSPLRTPDLGCGADKSAKGQSEGLF